MKPKYTVALLFLIIIIVLAAKASYLPIHRIKPNGSTAASPSPTFQPAQDDTVHPQPSSSQAPEQTTGSIIRLSLQQKADFISLNGISESELQAVAGLPDTYVINRSSTELKTVGTAAEPRRQYRALLTPNDYPSSPWYTDKIAAPSAWDISTGSSTSKVAVIDTGFALEHEDLVGRWAVGGKDFANNDNDPTAGTTNPNGAGVEHGTMTAGLIGATGNNAKGIASLNWSAKLLPLQVLSDDGSGYTEDVAAAIRYAVDQGVQVINLSLGSSQPDNILKAELDYAQDHDVVVVAAAGNCGDGDSYFLNGCDSPGQMLYPANYPQVIAVGATDSNDTRASFSSYGSNLDVVAPGAGSIATTDWSASDPTHKYTTGNIYGTSFASPIVAGLISLYRTVAPTATVFDVTKALQSSAEKTPDMGNSDFTNYYGYGRINAYGNLRWANIRHPNGTLILHPTTQAVYLVENDTKRLIPDTQTFLSYYQDVLSQAKPATPADIALPDGTNLSLRSGSLVKGSGLTQYVVALDGSTLTKYLVPDLSSLVGLGYNNSDLLAISDGLLESLPSGAYLSPSSSHPNGTLVIAPDGITVYLVENDSRRHVSNPWVLKSLNKGKYTIKKATAADMALPTSSTLEFENGAVVKGSGPAVYVIDKNSDTQKRHIGSSLIYSLLRFNSQERIDVPDTALPSSSGSTIN